MTSAAEVRLKRQDVPMYVPNSIRAKNVSSQGFRIPQSPSEPPQLASRGTKWPFPSKPSLIG